MRSHEEATRAVDGISSTVRPEVSAGKDPLLASVWDEQTYRILMMRDNLRQYADNMRKASSWFEKHKHIGGEGPEGRSTCRFFALGHGCIFGLNCKFAHGAIPRFAAIVNGAAGVPPPGIVAAAPALPLPRPLGGTANAPRGQLPIVADGEVYRSPPSDINRGQLPRDGIHGHPPPDLNRGKPPPEINRGQPPQEVPRGQPPYLHVGKAAERGSGGGSGAFGNHDVSGRPNHPQHQSNHGIIRDQEMPVRGGEGDTRREGPEGRPWQPEERGRRVTPHSDIKNTNNGASNYLANRGRPHPAGAPRRDSRSGDRHLESRGWYPDEAPVPRGDMEHGSRYRHQGRSPEQTREYSGGGSAIIGRPKHPAERRSNGSGDSRRKRHDSLQKTRRRSRSDDRQVSSHLNGRRDRVGDPARSESSERGGGSVRRGRSSSMQRQRHASRRGYHGRSNSFVFGSEEEFGVHRQNDIQDRSDGRRRGRSRSAGRGYRGDRSDRAERETTGGNRHTSEDSYHDGRSRTNNDRGGVAGGRGGRERKGGEGRGKGKEYREESEDRDSTSKRNGKRKEREHRSYGGKTAAEDDDDESSPSPEYRGGRHEGYRQSDRSGGASPDIKRHKGRSGGGDERGRRDRGEKRIRDDRGKHSRPEHRQRNRRNSYDDDGDESADDSEAGISHHSAKRTTQAPRVFAATAAVAPMPKTTFTVTASAADLPQQRQPLPQPQPPPVEVPTTRFSITMPPSIGHALVGSPLYPEGERERETGTWDEGGRGPGGRGPGGRGRGSLGRGSGGRGGRGRVAGRGRGGRDTSQRNPDWM